MSYTAQVVIGVLEPNLDFGPVVKTLRHYPEEGIMKGGPNVGM